MYKNNELTQPMKVGINGYGRIGKLVHKALIERKIEVSLINDPAITIDFVKYTLEHDSVHRCKNNFSIEIDGNSIKYNGMKTELTDKRNPEEVPWKKYDVGVVIDASGRFTTIPDCNGHIKAGAKRVIITAPSKDAPMFVMGVNDKNLKNENIISNASCTTNCLAPLAKILNEKFGIVEGLMTTVHAVTSSQNIVDAVCRKSYRLGRSGMSNIIPSTTGAALAVTQVIPELKGKLTGMAMRVPVENASVVDLTVKLGKPTNLQEIEKVFKEAEENEYKGIIGVSRDQLVSCDIIGDKRSCILDMGASIALNETFYKFIAWYDNEYAYCQRLADLVEKSLTNN